MCLRGKKILILGQPSRPDAVHRIQERCQSTVGSLGNLELIHPEELHLDILPLLPEKMKGYVDKQIPRENATYAPEAVLSQAIPYDGGAAPREDIEAGILFGPLRVDRRAVYFLQHIVIDPGEALRIDPLDMQDVNRPHKEAAELIVIGPLRVLNIEDTELRVRCEFTEGGAVEVLLPLYHLILVEEMGEVEYLPVHIDRKMTQG